MQGLVGMVDKQKLKNKMANKISLQVPQNMLTDKEPEIIARCKAQHIKFTDPEFPPEIQSLVGRPAR